MSNQSVFKKIKTYGIPVVSVLIIIGLLVPSIIREISGVGDPRFSMTEITLSTKTTSFNVWKADTEDTRTRGLSGLEELSKERGMLFVFERSDFWGIWMKEMNFPIDIVWIDENLSVVHVEKAVGPETYPKIFFPTKRARYVLELAANTAEAKGVLVGTKIVITE